MKWLKVISDFFVMLWRKIFGSPQGITSIKSEDAEEAIVPKQLGSGNPSAQQLRSLAENISHREAALDAKLVEAQIEGITIEAKTREREVEGKIANDKSLTDLRQKQLDLKAEETRRTQDRLDEEARAKIDRERFVAEQEQFRLNNEQAAAQAKADREQKDETRAARAAKQTQRREQRREAWKQLRAKAWENLKSSASWFAAKFGSVGSAIWSKVKLKSFLYFTGIILLLAGVYWLYQMDYLSYWLASVSVWLTQTSIWLAELWQYRWYALGFLIVGLLVWFGFSSRFATTRQSLKDAGVNSFANLNTFIRNLSIATGVLFAIGLSVVAIFGAYIGTPWIILGALGLIPIAAFSWRPGLGLWFRCLITLVLEMFALATFLPSAY